MSLKIKAKHPSRSRKMGAWLAAFAVLAAAGGAGPCLAQAGPASAAPAAPAAALDPERLAVATQVIDLSFPPEGRHAMLMSAADTMTNQVRAAVAEVTGGNSDPGAERILQRFLDRMRTHAEQATAEHAPALFVAMARAYARNFTRDELVQIRAFVSTPAGQKYLQKSMEMLADPDVARANTAYMRSVFSVLQPMQAELRQELQDYLRTRDERPARAPTR